MTSSTPVTPVPPHGPAKAPPFPWVGLLVLAAAVFLSVTIEMIPTGLLPDMSRDLGVGEPLIGLLVTVFAATVVVLTVPLSALTKRVPRRTLIVIALAVLAVSCVLTAIAPNYPTVRRHPHPRRRRARRLLVGRRRLRRAPRAQGAARPRRLDQRRRRLARVRARRAARHGARPGVRLAPRVRRHRRADAAGCAAGAAVPAAGASPRRRSGCRARCACAADPTFVLGASSCASSRRSRWSARTPSTPTWRRSSPTSWAMPASAISPHAAGLRHRRRRRPGARGHRARAPPDDRTGGRAASRPPSASPCSRSSRRCRSSASAAFLLWGTAFGALPPLLNTRLLHSASARIRDAAASFYTTAFNIGIGGGALLGAVLYGVIGLGGLPWVFVALLVCSTIALVWTALVNRVHR